MKRVWVLAGGVVCAVCLWSGSPASAALSAPCSAAVTKLTSDAQGVRAAYVTWATDLIARNATKAAADKTAARTALTLFISDFATLKTACATG